MRPNGTSESRDVAPAAFVPDARARAYLAAWIEVLDGKERPTSKTLATAMGLKGRNPEKALQKWRERHPEVDEWVNQQLEAEFERLRPRLLRRFERLAMAGSVPHAEFIAKVAGWFNPSPSPSQPATGGQVNNGWIVHVHR